MIFRQGVSFTYAANTSSCRGKGFIEIHHTKPVSSYDGEHEVRLEDIVALCSNCHSMIHYGGELMSIDELRKNVIKRKRDACNCPFRGQR